MVFGLLHQMLSWKMQNHLCGLTTCSEIIILCRAMKAYLFPIRFQFWASDVQSSPKKKNHLFRTEFQKERLFQKVILCLTFLDERSLVFVYSFWAQPYLLSKLNLIRSENILSMCFCEGTSFSEAILSALLDERFIFSSLLRMPKV